jgi:Flp pilus assembly protein TadB
VVLRDVAAARADLLVATAQARLSARILTVLPLIVLVGGLVTSASFRSSLLSLGVLTPVALGVALNRIGWRWSMGQLESVTRAASRFDLADIVDRVCVSLMAGCSLAQACESLGSRTNDTNADIDRTIALRVRQGLPLSECLQPLADAHSLQGRLFADVLVGAERDGLPVVATVARISQDVRIERRRRVDTAIRRIPVSLTIPLVCCVLPGFLLTTLVPLVASSVGSLTSQLPGFPIPLNP